MAALALSRICLQEAFQEAVRSVDGMKRTKNTSVYQYIRCDDSIRCVYSFNETYLFKVSFMGKVSRQSHDPGQGL